MVVFLVGEKAVRAEGDVNRGIPRGRVRSWTGLLGAGETVRSISWFARSLTDGAGLAEETSRFGTGFVKTAFPFQVFIPRIFKSSESEELEVADFCADDLVGPWYGEVI